MAGCGAELVLISTDTHAGQLSLDLGRKIPDSYIACTRGDDLYDTNMRESKLAQIKNFLIFSEI